MSELMQFQNAYDYMKQKESLGIKPGLARIKNTLQQLDHPQNKMFVIHVAGTNGKGTVAATLADALQKNGFKTGLFTSPWVVDYLEQIQIDGKNIDEETFTKYVSLLKQLNTDCTEFECLTAIAYRYFADENVDYAVIECGMGGAGDATNVEDNNLAVITGISLDHIDFLGNSREEIAKEKSGILRKQSDCILYGNEFEEIFQGKCRHLIVSEEPNNLSIVNTVLNYFHLSPVKTLRQLPARCERRGKLLLDGGHNVSAAHYLAPYLNHETAVIGMMKDKDVDGYLSVIAPKCKKIIAVQTNNLRSMPAEDLAKVAKKYCDDVVTIKDPVEAVKQENITLICGSFYLIREIIKII